MTLIERVKELRDNSIFPSSSEDDTIEHMDISITELTDLLNEVIAALTIKG